jgi:cytochrome P450
VTDVVPERLPSFPLRRDDPLTPPAEYEDLREQGPVVRAVDRAGKNAWFASSHRVARRLLADPHASKNGLNPGFPQLLVGQQQLAGQTKGFLVWMEPPDHTLYRRMLAGEFTPRRAQTMAPRVQQIVDECTTDLLAAGRPADLVTNFALPVTSLLICELLGVPYEERELFQWATAAILSHTSSEDELRTAFASVRDLMGRIIDDRSVTPEDDLLSRLIARYREAGVYDREHLMGMAVMLLGAGYETTANMIALGTVALLAHPEAVADLQADPSLAPKVVDELLRYLSIGDQVTCRVATGDIEVDGDVIRAGEGIIAPNGAANFDPDVFENPHTFDIRRNARPHLAFGYGIHQCLGQHLARTELETVFTTLFRRIPSLRLTVPTEELRYKSQAVFYGVEELPVTWE